MKLLSKKIIFAIFIAVSLGGLGFFFFRRQQKAFEVSTAVVSRGTVASSVSASGKIVSANKADVFAMISGTVWDVPVKDGQLVYKGHIILQLDTTSALATVASRELALKAALQRKTELEKTVYSETDLKSAEALVNEKRSAWVTAEEKYNEDKLNKTNRAARNTAYTAFLQADEELEDLRASNPTAESWSKTEAEVESAERELLEGKLNLARTTISAPQDGTLLYIESESGGGKINVNSIVALGQKLFTVADLNKMEFEAEVDESDIGNIEAGQRTTVILDAYPDLKISGKVSDIEKVVSFDSAGNKIVKAKIVFDEKPDVNLALGLFGDVRIITQESDGVLTVPLEAVFNEGGKTFVFVAESGRARKREITGGLETEESLEVISGVEVGEKVIVGDLKRVSDGQRVD